MTHYIVLDRKDAVGTYASPTRACEVAQGLAQANVGKTFRVVCRCRGKSEEISSYNARHNVQGG